MVFFLQATCVAYGNDFSKIYGRRGLDHFFLSSPIHALRDLLEHVLAYLDICQSWEELGKSDKDRRKTKGKSPVGELGRAFSV